MCVLRARVCVCINARLYFFVCVSVYLRVSVYLFLLYVRVFDYVMFV